MSEQSTMLDLGTRAPSFRLPDPSGKIISSDDFAGAPALLVVFLCNHCPYVKHVQARFAELATEYQARGVDWLQFLRGASLGGILADDMGLGKTVQTLAHLLIEQAEGRLTQPALIVCPTSLIPNWSMEAERFAPS